MNTVYIVTSKPCFAKGVGEILGVFATDDLAHAVIKQIAPDAEYNDTAEWYDNGSVLYEVEPRTAKTEMPSEVWITNRRARVNRMRT